MGLRMWIRTLIQSIPVTSSATLGLDQPLPKRGVRVDAVERLPGIMGI